ncbi:MAG: HAMP domain-containing protein [Geminicoccaceae bacterium]|nr:HAMP domain-containing protein [Geminicoccaceae bacterium]
MRLRPWPTSLMGQMTAVLVLALLAAQIVAVIVFAQDRERALILANRTQILDRTVSLTRILSITPPDRRQRVVDVSRSRGFSASIDGQAQVENDRKHRANPISRDIARRIDEHVPGPVLIDLDDDDGFIRRYRDHDGHDRDRPEPLRLIISIGLGDSQWLNLEHRLHPSPILHLGGPLLWVLTTAAAVCLAGAFMVRRITRPLRALALASDRFGRGEDVDPLTETGPSELARASSAFNRMRERIRRFVDDRTAMLAAISHDLRTPITTLRLRVEFLDDGEDKEKMLQTLAEMEAMTEAALAFMREEGKGEPMRPTDFASLVESLCDDLAEHGADIAFDADRRIVLPCRPVAMRRALRNLIENGVRYGHAVRLAIAEHPDRIELAIDDDGPGIPESDLERVFEPFVRLEESRSRDTGGTGLGLAIARSILRAHGGDVHLANRREGGLRASVTLPRDSAS